MEIEITHSPVNCYSKQDKPWLVWINGKVMTDKRGVGRRFKTREAAERAARQAN